MPTNGTISPVLPASPTACAGRSKADPTTEMGRYVVKVPDIGEGMTEAEIVAWNVAPGQMIREEDPLVDVMTDKATVELPAPVAGTVIEIHGTPGERRAVGSELVVLDVLGEGNTTEAIAAAPASMRAGVSPAQPLTPTLSPQAGRRGAPDQPQQEEFRGKKAESPQIFPVPASKEREGSALQAWEGEGQSSAPHAASLPIVRRPGTRPLASPAVRRRAWDLGIELQFVPGSGPGGRITHQDLDAYVASRPGSSASRSVSRGTARRDGVEDVPVVGLRRAIAEHLQKSK